VENYQKMRQILKHEKKASSFQEKFPTSTIFSLCKKTVKRIDAIGKFKGKSNIKSLVSFFSSS
jgi:hypothetical protein